MAKENLTLLAVGFGPMRKEMKINFEAKSDEEMLDEIGRSLVGIASVVNNNE